MCVECVRACESVCACVCASWVGWAGVLGGGECVAVAPCALGRRLEAGAWFFFPGPVFPGRGTWGAMAFQGFAAPSMHC